MQRVIIVDDNDNDATDAPAAGKRSLCRPCFCLLKQLQQKIFIGWVKRERTTFSYKIVCWHVDLEINIITIPNCVICQFWSTLSSGSKEVL